MNKEELLMCNAKETLEIANKCIEKLNNIMEEFTHYGYKYDIELESIDCSTVETQRKKYILKASVMKDFCSNYYGEHNEE